MKPHLAVFSALTVAVLAAGPLKASGVSTTRGFVIRGDHKIGAFAVKTDGTLQGAIEAFGRPTSVRRGRYVNCIVRWRSIGLRIEFYNLGGQNPCVPQYGYFGQALMTGKRWRTGNGVRVGDPIHKLHQRYRITRYNGYWLWLIVRSTRADCALSSGVCYYPGLEAKGLRGRVAAFRVNYASGGV